MSLRIEIVTKLQGALKERNKLEISTLRLILAAVKDRDIASRTLENRTEITKVCKEAIQSIKAQGPKDISKVMGILKKKYSDILDFAKAGEQVKEILK